jgi:hypothetical protein
MTELIDQIAKAIVRHRDLEETTQTNNKAVGRINTVFNGCETQFWLINKAADLITPTDFNGNIITTAIYTNNQPYNGDGKNVSKNSKLGGLFIQNHEGKHKIDVPNGSVEIEIFNRSTYSVPQRDNNIYAEDLIIKISGDIRSHSFKNIQELLSNIQLLQNEIESEKRKLEEATEEEAKLLLIRIEEKETKKQNYLDKAENFIRKNAQLRYQPILDPIQENIKRSNIFEGALIINGGPGTGKTTSLIQRIKFLISPSIEEYTKLTSSQKDLLFNEKTSWIFYSPNELLALFLRNSMKMEDLIANTESVKVWNTHKNELVTKAYKLVDVKTQRPFLLYKNSQGTSFFQNNSNSIKSITDDFLNSFLAFQKEKIVRVIEIDTSIFKWKNLGQSIQKYLLDKKDVASIEEIIRLFVNLNQIYKAESDTISEEYTTLIKQVASKIQVGILKDSERAIALSEILKNLKSTTQDIDDDDDEDDDDTQIEIEDFEEQEELLSSDFEKELFVKIKSLCRKQALKKFDKNTKFSKKDKELLKYIQEIENQTEFEVIGQVAFFKKFFERITKGVTANVLREIPMIYKKFRRNNLNVKNSDFDLILLEELVKKDKNSRIHQDEQALLLFFINNVCSKLARNFQVQFNQINHSYVSAYKINCKPVIGIDEASDFSIIDLLAINSLAHHELSSVTLAGDIMQRMTKDGLDSWEDFTNLTFTERKDLEVSYRQSPTLLALAKSIYEKSTGTIAKYRSYIDKDEAEPKPLMIISDDEEKKLEWISERVLEIYKAYNDIIPSIAIFLPAENQLEDFANKLGNINRLTDVGIFVKACRNGEVLGDENTVRVFSIDKIKGLEFEAVFFHNLDTIQNQNLSDDLLLKYLYVGLSRATFYLGITTKTELNENLKFILDNFGSTGNWTN